ncbi:hypothetical protein EVAR_61348_1 [Eumeta japonica]|uniref:Uncharacterized protein n=1 Tax=Eumeta variegata TaxID=151549 RepID=A0A4C1Y2E2_EUMVA|nr:hypothetical protein EVAR_61348_1 [Eumeta japonica]
MSRGPDQILCWPYAVGRLLRTYVLCLCKSYEDPLPLHPTPFQKTGNAPLIPVFELRLSMSDCAPINTKLKLKRCKAQRRRGRLVIAARYSFRPRRSRQPLLNSPDSGGVVSFENVRNQKSGARSEISVKGMF